ncbi:MAG: Nopaline-binding periplasmic protein [Anaerolineales bacterium]|nr:Nopaline-binding periplasmic protein [Anaerolineales bacterium]
MKKLLLILSSTVVLGLLAACASGGVAPAQPTEAPPPAEAPAEEVEAGALPDLGGQEIRVAVENAYPPFNFIDEETNEPVGWDYDAWREICDRLNCEPVFVESAWEGLFEAMAAGQYDVAADGITITEERDKIVDYSIPYLEYGQVILVSANEQTIVDKDSLISSDTTVGVQLGTTNEKTAIELVGEDRIKSFDTFDTPVVALMSGDVDAVIIDKVAAVGFMGANQGKLKMAADVTSGELLGFVYPPDSELIEPVNAALESMQADGTLKQLNDEWFEPKS